MDSDSVAASVVSDHPQTLELDQASDDEWDELASDIEEDAVERIPGESLLPSLRLENIIKADGMMGSLALSKEGLFILSVATEEFIKRLAQGGHRQASAERRMCVDYRDMAATTQQYQEFMFLQETIPFPVSLKEALELRELKLKELVADNPALITPTSNFPANGTTPSTYKPKVKSRPNGKEIKSRHASSSRSESRAHSQVRWDYRDMPPSNGVGHVPASALSTRGGLDPANGWHRWANGQNVFTADVPPNPHNGLTSISTPSVNGRTPPPRPGDTQLSSAQLAANYWQRAASTWSKPPLDSLRPDSISNGHIALPQSQADSSATSAQASGSALAPDSTSDAAGSSSRGLGGIGPSSLVSENPGRTIYSQTKPLQTAQ